MSQQKQTLSKDMNEWVNIYMHKWMILIWRKGLDIIHLLLYFALFMNDLEQIITIVHMEGEGEGGR